MDPTGESLLQWKGLSRWSPCKATSERTTDFLQPFLSHAASHLAYPSRERWAGPFLFMFPVTEDGFCSFPWTCFLFLFCSFRYSPFKGLDLIGHLELAILGRGTVRNVFDVSGHVFFFPVHLFFIIIKAFFIFNNSPLCIHKCTVFHSFLSGHLLCQHFVSLCVPAIKAGLLHIGSYATSSVPENWAFTAQNSSSEDSLDHMQCKKLKL